MLTECSKPRRSPRVRSTGAAVVLLALGALAPRPAATAAADPSEETRMLHARGEFDVQVKPLPLDGSAEDPKLGRLSLEKTFRGDLEGSGRGQMLTAEGEVAGSAAYVAVERVSGSIAGRAGGFALLHRGVMAHGGQRLEITVVPDSGTGALAGIDGVFHVRIEGGKHFYDLEYALSGTP